MTCRMPLGREEEIFKLKTVHGPLGGDMVVRLEWTTEAGFAPAGNNTEHALHSPPHKHHRGIDAASAPTGKLYSTRSTVGGQKLLRLCPGLSAKAVHLTSSASQLYISCS